MEPRHNKVPWYQKNCWLQAVYRGQEVVWGGEKVEPGEMRWCRQSTLVHLLKSFLKLYEPSIERARYCPQHRKSVNMKTFDTRMVSHNGSIKGMSLGSAASPPPPPLPPPGHRFFLFDPVFCPFPPLWSWFQTIQIWSIRNRENILNER